jgi:hypothetical protein
MNVAGRELVKLLVIAKDDDRDVDGAEDAQFVCLLEQAAFTLQKGAATTVSIDRLRCKRQPGHTQSGSCHLLSGGSQSSFDPLLN